MLKKFSRNKNHEFHENTCQELFSSIMHVIMKYLLLMNYYFWSSRVCFLSTLARRINGLVYWCTIHCHESRMTACEFRRVLRYTSIWQLYTSSHQRKIYVLLKETIFTFHFALLKEQNFTPFSQWSKTKNRQIKRIVIPSYAIIKKLMGLKTKQKTKI